MKFGIDVLLGDAKLKKELAGRRIGLLAHPASMTSVTHVGSPLSKAKSFIHSLDALMLCPELRVTAALGPQHGIRGEKQDNMMETVDFVDPAYGIPVFSLYGKVRRPTAAMLDHFDVFLIDLQDIGTRIYTFLTTLTYVLEAAAQYGKAVWVLDRPNPAGRPVEGALLQREKWTSFVGAVEFPMRHGLTLGEAAQWFVKNRKLNVELKVVPMQGYDPTQGPGYGWPLGEMPWVNPSPNAASLSMTRCFPGTVLLEGTCLSEGRGTTRPLEVVGAPGFDSNKILKQMFDQAPEWLRGCHLRPCFFQPTFHKFADQVCGAIQIHVDDDSYRHQEFKPYRLIALYLKVVRQLYPEFNLWRNFHYEYETERLAIDLINGGTGLRDWVDDARATAADFEKLIALDEKSWLSTQADYFIYSPIP